MKDKVEKHSMFIRVPAPLYKEMLAAALRASAVRGVAVSVQTIALERMERSATNNEASRNG